MQWIGIVFMLYLPAVEVETGPEVDASVIWLHGLGANGHDFEPIIPELGLPESAAIRFIFPHAPSLPVTVNGGMVMPAWYDIIDMTMEREVDEAQLLKSAAATSDLIDRERERGISNERIVIAGFSQGGAVAYQSALTYPEPLAGLLALSTYLATAGSIEPSKANQSIPIMVCHGKMDMVVPEFLGHKAVETLKAMQYQPEFKTYIMQHGVCPEEITDIGDWLRTVLSL